VTVPCEYFDTLYRLDPDPWGFATRWYEARKRDLLLASLPERCYDSAFEPGCSIGLVTEALAPRCASLFASDCSDAALSVARARLALVPHVAIERRRLPEDWPEGAFDLVVLSELLYYFDERDLDAVVRRSIGAVAPGGTLASVHWRHPVADYPLSGDDVEQALAERARGQLVLAVDHREQDFLLRIHLRPYEDEDPERVSVAQRGGLC
jgi:SAM-dependent methyltransferase